MKQYTQRTSGYFTPEGLRNRKFKAFSMGSIEPSTLFKNISLLLFVFFLSPNLKAQWNFFAVELSEGDLPKDPRTTTLNQLTKESYDRKKAQGIAIDYLDIDINPRTISEIEGLGLEVVYKSRWLKTIVVATRENSIPKSNFIKNYWLIDTMSLNKWPIKKSTSIDSGHIFTKHENSGDVYGKASGISDFLGLRKLHKSGYTGKGIKVVVFDGGFSNVHKLNVFDSMKAENRFWFYKDFSQNSSNIFSAGQHGTQVLSCMSAYQPGTYIGTGYGATYGIIATETGGFESPLEEWAWIQGLEEADRLGADIIQCSLGYTTFDNPEFNHTNAQLAQSNSPMFRAAKIAAEKGILLVNSAGNEGDGKWKYVGFPSGSENIIAVAAAFPNGEIADFSSHGYPTGFSKPNVTAIGVKTPCISSSGHVVGATGTSFAAPSLAGGMTCLMQLYPNRKPEFYMQLLRAISNHSLKHDTRSGYGIPNFSLALNYSIPNSKMPFYSVNSNLDTLYQGQEIKTFRKPCKKYKVKLTNRKGNWSTFYFEDINELCKGAVLGYLPEGNYTLIIRQGLKRWKKKIYFAASESIDN